THRSIGDTEKSRGYYREALERARAKGYKEEEGGTLYRLGLQELTNRNTERALYFLFQSFTIFEHIRYLRHKIYCLIEIGHVLEQWPAGLRGYKF
ncbi:MAG: hypothetical protein ACFFG0_33300, partial [Candidatus Thorarchaeota archaeon]